MIYSIPKLRKALCSTLAATLFVSFAMVDAQAEPLPAQAAKVAEQAPAKKPRAKRAVKKVAKKAKPAAVREAAPPAAEPVAQAAPPHQAGAMQVAAPIPAWQYSPRTNPYLANQPQAQPVAPVGAPPAAGDGVKFALPQLPLFEQSILPKIKTVYPTGEKPLVVVTFKCPTEIIGIDTPSTVILHKAVNGGMDLVNRSNLLSFNMQQVCQ